MIDNMKLKIDDCGLVIDDDSNMVPTESYYEAINDSHIDTLFAI